MTSEISTELIDSVFETVMRSLPREPGGAFFREALSRGCTSELAKAIEVFCQIQLECAWSGETTPDPARTPTRPGAQR